MALLRRTLRVLKADMNAVIERLEDPHALLDLSLAEMSDALEADRGILSDARHEQAAAESQIQQIDAEIERLDGELDICFEQKQDALARDCVKRKLICQARRESLSQDRRQRDSLIAETQQRITENRERLNIMRSKAALARTTPAGQPAPGPSNDWPVDALNEREVELALLAEKHRRSRS